MDMNMFCVLCGGPFDLEQGVVGVDPEKPAFQWLYNVRMLGTPSALHSHRMTTDGEFHPNLSDDPDVFLSETIRWQATDADCLRLGDSFYNVLLNDANGDVVFPLHDACVQIGCRAQRSCDLSQAHRQGSSDLARLYHRLRRQYQYAKTCGAVPDIFSLRTSRMLFGPRSVQALDDLGWWSGAYERFLSDPMDIPGLTFAAFNLLQPMASSIVSPACIATLQLPRGLEALPCEILERITEYLTPNSVMSLRRASRSLALSVPLDDRFWRRHMCSGGLLPYIWDLDEDQMKRLLQSHPTEVPRDWHGLARVFRPKECLRRGQDPLSGEIPAGLWNRCRIWSMIDEACGPLNDDTRRPIAIFRRSEESAKLKTQTMRTLGFSILTVLFVLVIAYDVRCHLEGPYPV